MTNMRGQQLIQQTQEQKIYKLQTSNNSVIHATSGNTEGSSSMGRANSPPSFSLQLKYYKTFLQTGIHQQNTLESYNNFEKFLQLIEMCPNMPYFAVQCQNPNCNHVLMDDDGNRKRYKTTCGNKYCTDQQCIQKRIYRNIAYLSRFKPKRVIHFVISFPYTPGLHKQEKLKQEKILTKFHKIMLQLGTPIKAVRVFDVHEEEGLYQMHYHYAQYPTNYNTFFQNMNLARQFLSFKGIILVSKVIGWRNWVVKGYKGKVVYSKCVSYFAKRASAVFGHKEKYYYFKDFMTPLEFYKNLWNSKSIAKVGLKGKLPAVRQGILYTLGITPPEICPCCKQKSLRFVLESLLEPEIINSNPPPC